jgi:hypothetical protein
VLLALGVVALAVVVALAGLYATAVRVSDLTTTTTTPAATTTTTAPADPLEARVAALTRRVGALEASRGLTGPQVRALVETLLPEPSPPPPDTTTTETTAIPRPKGRRP